MLSHLLPSTGGVQTACQVSFFPDLVPACLGKGGKTAFHRSCWDCGWRSHHHTSYPAHCSEPGSPWQRTWWVLVSWEKAEEMLHLYNKKEQKEF